MRFLKNCRRKRTKMRMLTMLAVMLGLTLPGAVAAETGRRPGAMSVAVFLAKADALRTKGAMALFSSDYGKLKAELTGAAQVFRSQVNAEAATGNPSACPPNGAALTSDDLIKHMQSYPVAARPRIAVADAVADLFRKRFPCPAR
jgi:hypothetical protein